jgi:hypothetical protein
MDGGQDAQRSATGGAFEDVDGEHPAQQIGPGVTARDATSACGGRGRGRAGSGGVGRDDTIAPPGAGGEHAVVADQVGARRRDERDEALQELLRLEEDRGGPVAPAMAEAVE